MRQIVLSFESSAIAEANRALFDAPHVAVTETGKGKTFFSWLALLYSSFMNVQSLFVDPKGEKRKWFTKLIQDPYYQKHYPCLEHLQNELCHVRCYKSP